MDDFRVSMAAFLAGTGAGVLSESASAPTNWAVEEQQSRLPVVAEVYSSFGSPKQQLPSSSPQQQLYPRSSAIPAGGLGTSIASGHARRAPLRHRGLGMTGGGLEAALAELALPPEVLARVAEAVEEVARGRARAAEHAEKAASRRSEQLEAQYRALSEEYTRLEGELAGAVRKGAQAQEQAQELARVQAQAQAQQSEAAQQAEVEARLRDTLDGVLCASDRLRDELEEQTAEVRSLGETLQAAERGRAAVLAEARGAAAERDAVMGEYQRAVDALKEREETVRAQAGALERAHAESATLAHVVEEMQRLQALHEDTIEELRATAMEQATQIEMFRRSNGSAAVETHGSVLNEIEDLVASQMKDSEAYTHAMTVALLQRVLPSMAATDLGSGGGGNSGDGGGSSPGKKKAGHGRRRGLTRHSSAPSVSAAAAPSGNEADVQQSAHRACNTGPPPPRSSSRNTKPPPSQSRDTEPPMSPSRITATIVEHPASRLSTVRGRAGMAAALQACP